MLRSGARQQLFHGGWEIISTRLVTLLIFHRGARVSVKLAFKQQQFFCNTDKELYCAGSSTDVDFNALKST